jgi:hypothetical protein
VKGLDLTLALCLLLTIPAVGQEPIAGPGTVLRPGDEGTVLTVLQGNHTREIPATYLGIYRNFSGPGYDLHLVQLEGPVAESVGVAAGMSGSPVYFGGKLIGALSYRLGFMPKTAVGGVTPIEDILDAVREEPRRNGAAEGLEPIATPIVAGGLSLGAREWLGTRLNEMGFVLAAGGDAGSGGTSPTLAAGSPVGAELVRGDMRIAATGTVTRVDGDRVYAFGHPFLGSGRVEMPMVTVDVIHTLADLAGSVKLANVGEEIGAIVEDRHAAIVGRIGQKARMIPVDLTVRGADYGERPYHFEVIKHGDLAPILAAVSVLNALQSDAGYSDQATLLARGSVRMHGLPVLPLEMAVAGAVGTDPAVALASELMAILGAIWSNPFLDPDVIGIELAVDARREIKSYRLVDLYYDRDRLRPGETLTIQCALRPFRGEPIQRSLNLTLPERLPDGDGLVLVVGNPREIDIAMGNILLQRFRSAADPEAYMQVLSDLYAPNRLSAMIVERGGSVISGGGAFVQLPPTAERLLATQATETRRRLATNSPIATAEIELDGPVTGMQQARLRVSRDRGVEKR